MSNHDRNVLNSAFVISEDFMKDPKHVNLNQEAIKKIAETMLTEGKEKTNVAPLEEDGYNFEDEVKLELLASSINYCFWYGRHDVRPGEASSTLMYALLVNEYSYNNRVVNEAMLENFSKKLIEYRFPLIEDRLVHLDEAFDFGKTFAKRLLVMKNNLQNRKNVV